ncbi:DUF1304 family protein [Streptomyces lichenis]|uniref:DUF1304 family protein n=1 Tax=Streptomyces lichenis TaxID=2306967 RepID=UPI003556331F
MGSLVAVTSAGWRRPRRTGNRRCVERCRRGATGCRPEDQGLHHGFLAAGLVRGLLADDPVRFPVRVFLPVCVVVAGVHGGPAG